MRNFYLTADIIPADMTWQFCLAGAATPRAPQNGPTKITHPVVVEGIYVRHTVAATPSLSRTSDPNMNPIASSYPKGTSKPSLTRSRAVFPMYLNPVIIWQSGLERLISRPQFTSETFDKFETIPLCHGFDHL